MESEGEISKVILSSLLHDIGKFIGRSEGQKRLAHEKLGEDFLKSLSFEEPKKSILDSVARIIGAHHDPDTLCNQQEKKIAYTIQLADWLSSTERITSYEDISVQRWEQNLVSVFEEISLDDIPLNLGYNNTHKFPLKTLSFDKETIFPAEQPTSTGYTEMYNDFRQELSLFLKEWRLKDSFGPLLSIIEKYFWSIPSATYSKTGSYLPDVSLYDHSRITSAIALSLYRGILYDKDEKYVKEILNALKEKKEDFHTPLFTMIHGDFSGIQNFITNISSKLAAKSLKGRSTGLVIMQRLIMEHFLKRLGLDLLNALYSGGGHFYLIAPYSEDKAEINNIQNDVNNVLFDHFGLDLYLSIGTVDVYLKDFYTNKGITLIWRKLSESVSEDKSEKFRNLGYKKLFEPKGFGGIVDTCDVCGKEISSGGYKTIGRYSICNDCYGFVELAEYLKDASKTGYLEVSELKKKLHVLETLEVITESKFALDFQHNYDNTHIKFYPVFVLPLGFPLKNNKIKEFDELANDSYERTGTRKIGIFKADVDNLGKIFMNGLGKGENSLATLSRISTLSRLFSVFFEGYINTLRDKEDYKDSIYLIYSGGDDILAIGAWDKMICFARDLYEDFKKFVCSNDEITMSASIVVTSPHSSLRTVLREAEEKLEMSKDSEIEIKGNIFKKSAIDIFGEILYWDGIKESDKSEFERALAIANKIEKIAKKENGEEGVSRSLAIEKTKFLATYTYNKLKEGKLDAELLSVFWLLRYFWIRNVLNKHEEDQDKEGSEAQNVLNEINSVLEREIFKKKTTKSVPRLQDLVVGLRIAELRTRRKESEILN